MAYRQHKQKQSIIKACDAAIAHHTRAKLRTKHFADVHDREIKRANVLKNKAELSHEDKVALFQHDVEWLESWITK